MSTLKLNKVKGEERNVYMGEGKSKKKRILPRITLKGQDLPEMKGWKVGDKYMVVMEVEMVAMKQGQEYEFEPSDDKSTTGTFAIHAVGEYEEEEEDFQTTYGKVRSAAAAKR